MSFQQGLSGLNAAAKALDVTSNNVANTSTVGYKASTAQFQDVYAASLGGAGASQIGIGTQVAQVAQQFTQGNITITSNPLDIAINGAGFFRMSDNGTISYSRNGQFNVDKDGHIVNAAGLRLTGFPADPNGIVVPATPADLLINSSDLQPSATTSVETGVNLDSRVASPSVVPFNPSNPLTYNSSTSVTVFDSLGNPHVMTMYFVKDPAPAVRQWTVHANMDGGAITSNTLNFNTNGALTTAMPLAAITFPVTSGASNIVATLDFSGTTAFGSTFGVNRMSQNGYTSGQLSGVAIGADGLVQGRYSNGRSRNMGQVVLANFNNAGGLTSIGANQWTESAESGTPLIGAPGSASLGAIQSGAVEDSNVDLTAELVNMITQQRTYQANAQSIRTQDQILQTLVNLR